MGIELYLGFAIAILFLGIYCIMTKKNIIKSAIGISIMVKGGSLSFLVAGGTTAQVAVVLVIIVDAIVAAVLLSMAVNVYRHTGSLDFDALKRLWG
ncbi:MAG TPA: NADH-quinone oxidoreductase subunit K [Candidatus Thermoplasmatota archaeon]|nr:NADH-quinone oxidoreductase subunit K [Candidatus Thermoplasmatota archaeon]